MVTAAGEEVIPTEYDELQMIGHRMYRTRQADRIGFAAFSGYGGTSLPRGHVITLQRLLPCDYETIGNNLMSDIIPVKQNGKWGFIHWKPQADGTDEPVLVIPPKHAAEIDNQVTQALIRLRYKGITLLNQAVLLKGINDNVDTLKQLSERLFQAGVLPYYLHLLDKIQGAAHFDSDESSAQRLLGQLSAHLPGYLMPKLVREIAGEASKTLLLPLL